MIHSLVIILILTWWWLSNQEKLEAKKYSTASSFEFDFGMMFDNVFLYYPLDSLQYSKALELKQMFVDISGELRAKLR